MKSIVERFYTKRIHIEDLEQLLTPYYQQECLLNLALEYDEINRGYITKEDHKWFSSTDIDVEEKLIIKYHSLDLISLSNSLYTFFMLLSNDQYSINKIYCISKTKVNNKIITIVFDNRVDSKDIINRVFISPMDWVNRIITHGIIPKILNLQYIRDSKYYTE